MAIKVKAVERLLKFDKESGLTSKTLCLSVNHR